MLRRLYKCVLVPLALRAFPIAHGWGFKVGIVGGSRPCNVHSHIGLTNQDTICSFGFVKYCDNPAPHGDPIEGDDFVDQFSYFVGFPFVDGTVIVSGDLASMNITIEEAYGHT